MRVEDVPRADVTAKAGCSMFLPHFLPHPQSKRVFLIVNVRYSASVLYQVGALPCRFQRMLHLVENARGVFRDGDRPKHGVVTVRRDSLL